jgi:MFS family permease
MYPSVRPAVLTEPAPVSVSEPDARRPWVSANVVYIGLTSLFTDVSSEMVTAILPLYLVFQLRLTPLQFGVFNGVYLAVAGLMSIAGAVIADRRRRYKEIAATGYGISAACKVGLLAARNAPLPASSVLFADRVGKGVRTSPRDALISLSSEPGRLGRSFGVHRAFDTVGAVAGPIVAFLVLRAAPNAYDAVFVISFLFALLGLGMLVLFVENRREALGEHRSATWRGAMRLLTEPRFRTLVIVGSMFGLFTIADAFIYLTFQNRSTFETAYFPLLYVGTAISYLLLAVPLGSLADRVGRSRVFLAGYVLLLGVYLVLLAPSLNGSLLVALLALLGAFYACTDGVLIAMTSVAVSEARRSSGIAVLTTAAALSGFAASLTFGAMWSWWGPTATVRLFTGALAIVIVIAAVMLRVRTRMYG